MKEKFLSKLIAIILICSMTFSVVACNGEGEGAGAKKGNIQSKNLMADIEKNTQIDEGESANNSKDAVTDFSVRLLQNSLEKDKNTLISPLSVIMALAMTGNGAKGETLSQMETTFGTQVSALNAYLSSYMNSLPQGKKYKLQLADSIWFIDDDSFTVNQEFLQTNANYYGADIYKSAFDESTLEDINMWVEQKTDGMIKDILDEIPQDAVMYLVNALIFEAEWEEIYEESNVHEGIFTTEDGIEKSVEMMYSDETLYIEDEQATGFIKYYSGQKYAFVALLPKEGVTVSDYVESLSGEGLRALLKNPTQIHVNAAIPQFETEYDVLMNDVLIQMGMEDAFDGGKADFTGLGTSTNGNIFINRIIHKTYITVGPKGTKAGAATVAEMNAEGAPYYEESKTVYLDRPFVYMLIDCQSNQPFFMGTMMNITE